MTDILPHIKDCSKVPYVTLKEAKSFIKAVKKDKSKSRLKLTYAYKCNLCNHYHVTSMPKQKRRWQRKINKS